MRLAIPRGIVFSTTKFIGTLTAYDPITERFYALAHAASNKEKVLGLPVYKPTKTALAPLTPFQLQHIHNAEAGALGVRAIQRTAILLGMITGHGSSGAVGTLDKPPTSPLMLTGKAEIGSADLLCDAIPGGCANIQITNLRTMDAVYGPMIMATMPSTAAYGMSGSPIIQHDKIIGALMGCNHGQNRILIRDINEMMDSLDKNSLL